MRFRFMFMCVLLVLALTATYVVAAPIHDAAGKGDLAKVKALLKANPKLVNLAGKDDATPLHYAVAEGHKAVVEFLLASKADVNAKKTNGVTPLHIAAAMRETEIGVLLLARGADVAATDKNGRTPISLGFAGWPAYMRNVKLVPDVRIRISPKDSMPQVLIPSGEFTMGSDSGGFDDEKPARKVHISAFWMDMHEVTYEQYCRFLNDAKPDEQQRKEWLKLAGEPEAEFKTGFVNGPKISFDGEGYTARPGFSRDPIAWVTWHGADAYAKWAGRSLPSEAQWERASRAGKEGQEFSWGDGPPPPGTGNFGDELFQKVWPEQANTSGMIDSFSSTSPACSFRSNAFGLFDMDGNLSEWCLDLYEATWYARMPNRDPVNLGASTKLHSARGSDFYTGGFASNEDARKEVRPSVRMVKKPAHAMHPDGKTLWDNIGFRCASPAGR